MIFKKENLQIALITIVLFGLCILHVFMQNQLIDEIEELKIEGAG